MTTSLICLAVLIAILAQAGDGARVRFLRPLPVFVNDQEAFGVKVQWDIEKHDWFMEFAAVDEASETWSRREYVDQFPPRTRIVYVRLQEGDWTLIAAVFNDEGKEVARATHVVHVLSRRSVWQADKMDRGGLVVCSTWAEGPDAPARSRAALGTVPPRFYYFTTPILWKTTPA